jgi:hypothetical protein
MPHLPDDFLTSYQNPKAKHSHRKDAKTANEQQKSPDYSPCTLVTLAYVGPILKLRLIWISAFAKMTEGFFCTIHPLQMPFLACFPLVGPYFDRK